jgi:FkbM family methyltransferase
MRGLARFGKDCYCVLRSPHNGLRKTRLLVNLVHPSSKMLGFEISAFDRSSLAFFYREIFARQNYFFRTHNVSPVIIDCGANIGMATLYFKWLYPNARIEAFEPDPKTFQLLEKNVRQNDLRDVVVHNCALWDTNGEIDFFVDPLIPGSTLMSTDNLRMNGERIRVPSRKLSDFVRGPIDFVKVDVEGAENRLLCDLVASGKIDLVEQMVVEYHHHISNHRSCLAEFLQQLEHAGLEYQIDASVFPVTSGRVFQDILIGVHRAADSNH